MKNLTFPTEPDDFYKELKKEVKNYFDENKISPYANSTMLWKLGLMFVLYLVTYSCIYLFGSNLLILFILYPLLGALSVFLGLNIGHDSAHNAIFKKTKNNKTLLIIFELIGTSSYNWKNRHLGAHHRFPNIMDYDSDVQQTNIVKIFPNDRHYKHHSFQHLYMPLAYMIYTLRWVLYRDFKDSWSEKIGVYQNSPYPKKEIYKMVFFKLFYVTYMVVLPFIFLDYSFLIISLAFLSLLMFGSLVITMVLLSTHVGENAVFPEPDEKGVLPYSWSHHQVITTADFSTNNWLINHLFGGFNHHVIHHLFPHICHIHYPKITPILKELSKKYNLPYRNEKYVLMAILSHFKLLHFNSKNTDL